MSQQPISTEHTPEPVLVVGSGATAHRTHLRRGEQQHVGGGGREVDVCFVFDTTGSMSGKIDGLVASMSGLVTELAALDLDWRMSVVPFGDLKVAGDRIVDELPFVDSVEAATDQLRQMPRFSGGGNGGESSIEATLAALTKPFRAGAVKVLVLLTDDHAHQNRVTADMLHGQLLEHEVVTFVAAVDTPYYRRWAAATGGEWFAIGTSVETASVLELLRELCRKVAVTAADVHALGGGSVATYRALPAADRR